MLLTLMVPKLQGDMGVCQGPKVEKPQGPSGCGRRALGAGVVRVKLLSVPPALDAGVTVVLGGLQDVYIARAPILPLSLEEQVTDPGAIGSVPFQVPSPFGWTMGVAVPVVCALIDWFPGACSELELAPGPVPGDEGPTLGLIG
jgi:hypothetical protein